MKTVIIGGVAGGATAAARIRRLDERAQVVVLERTGYMSYANCGLPYYIGGVIEDKEELTLQTPQSFFDRFAVDVRVRHEALKIDTKKKSVRVRNLETGEEYEESYDKLLLATGAQPTLRADDAEGVFCLRTVEDTFAIASYLDTHKVQSAVVAGGGFIGLEMAENLRERGVDVTIVQRPPQLLPPLDEEMASFVHANMRAHGVKLLFGKKVAAFRNENGRVRVVCQDGQELLCDMAITAAGVTPDTALAREAGLEMGVRGSIVVDEHMKTSAEDVYAAGDAVQVRHFVSGKETLVSLAGPANKQGRVAADNICGLTSAFRPPLGSSVIKLFSQTAAFTGLNERAARQAGLDADSVILSPGAHAGYYPGAETMTMKVVFEKGTLRLLGAQIVGGAGVDKRIDVLAACVYAGLDAIALKDLDLAYAPPYSSAKDPVNMAGFMIENLSRGLVRQAHLDDLDALRGEGATLLDTRTAGEYARGHAEGFVNIPLDELRGRLDELPRGKRVCVMCQSGLRSYVASRILMQNGFDCLNFSGGYRLYHAVKDEQCAAACSMPCGAEKI